MRWFVACVFLLACLSAWPISPGELTELQGISLDFEIALAALEPASATLTLALQESRLEIGSLQLLLSETRQGWTDSQRELSEAREQLGIWRMELDSSAQLIVALQDSFGDYRKTSEFLRRRTAFTWAVGGLVIGAGVTLAVIGLIRLL